MSQNRVALVLLSAVALTGACSWFRSGYHVAVTTEMMTWECLPERLSPGYPSVRPVRLRFAADPRYGIVVVSTGLCDHLTRANKEVVEVDFNAWGNSSHGLIGFNHTAIDGSPFMDSAPGGTSFFEQQDATAARERRHPLSRSFE